MVTWLRFQRMKAVSQRPVSSAPLVFSLRDCPAVGLWPWLSPVLKCLLQRRLPFVVAAQDYAQSTCFRSALRRNNGFPLATKPIAPLEPWSGVQRGPVPNSHSRYPQPDDGLRVVMARWVIGRSGAAAIGKVRLLQCVMRRIGQRGVSGVMQPGVPFGRNPRRIHASRGHYPSAHPQATASGTTIYEVAISGGVNADLFAVEEREQPGSDIHV